ncbi:hypothetical protein AOLI_G00018460 [Acnodon oligacanthus]
MIRLQRYTLNVSYIPGKFMYTADTLSRAVDLKAPSSHKTAEEVQAYVSMVTSSLPIADAKMQLIRAETEKDQILKQFKQVVLTGWSQERQQCVSDIQEYWNCRAELTVVNDVIYKGSKIVIPKSLRKLMLEKVHEGHVGMEKSENVITCMKSIFSRHGVPTEVITDNGPQFSGADFKAFSEEWDFVHTTSSPHFPQSNGLVEKSVGIVKKLMRKAKDGGGDFYKALLAYRSTPLGCGFSLAQLFMGRCLRSNLPVKEDLLETKEGRTVRQLKEIERSKQKIYYDRKTRQLPELHEGDGVRLKDKEDTWGQKKLNQTNSGSETLQDTHMLNTDQEKSSIMQENDKDQQTSVSQFLRESYLAETHHHRYSELGCSDCSHHVVNGNLKGKAVDSQVESQFPDLSAFLSQEELNKSVDLACKSFGHESQEEEDSSDVCLKIVSYVAPTIKASHEKMENMPERQVLHSPTQENKLMNIRTPREPIPDLKKPIRNSPYGLEIQSKKEFLNKAADFIEELSSLFKANSSKRIRPRACKGHRSRYQSKHQFDAASFIHDTKDRERPILHNEALEIHLHNDKDTEEPNNTETETQEPTCEIKCEASVLTGPESSEPVYKPPHFVQKLKSREVPEGSKVQLDCIVRGFPAPEVR